MGSVNKDFANGVGKLYATPQEFMDCVDAGSQLLNREDLCIIPASDDEPVLKDALAVCLSMAITTGRPDQDRVADRAQAIRLMVLAAYNLGRHRGATGSAP